jgi:hypothetical protein
MFGAQGFQNDRSPFLPEENAGLRDLYSEKAKKTNRDQAPALPEPADEGEDAMKQLDIGVGLQGVGDNEFPISVKLLEELSSQKQFVKRCSAEWKRIASGAVSESAKMKDTRTPASRCLVHFCWTAVQSEQRRDPIRAACGLLQNVLRHMRQDSWTKAGLTFSGKRRRHPLVVVKVSEMVFGWLITRASFKPLHLYGWRLNLDREALDSGEESVAELVLTQDTATGKSLPHLQSTLSAYRLSSSFAIVRLICQAAI